MSCTCKPVSCVPRVSGPYRCMVSMNAGHVGHARLRVKRLCCRVHCAGVTRDKRGSVLSILPKATMHTGSCVSCNDVVNNCGCHDYTVREETHACVVSGAAPACPRSHTHSLSVPCYKFIPCGRGSERAWSRDVF